MTGNGVMTGLGDGMVGTRALVRLALRRDRIMLPGWLLVFVAMASFSAAATKDLYPTVESRMRAAAAANHTPALVALYGRVYDTTSLGGIGMLKLGGMGAAMVALLTIFIVVRHTRAEEESGRLELLGATVVGRYAPLTAAFTVAVLANLSLGVLTGLGLTAAGLPADGSFAFGFAWAGVGIAFAAIAAVVAQLTTTARATVGVSAVTLAVVYAVRAVGDTSGPDGPRWLSWLSPIGWGQQFRPYAGNRWWVLLITVGFALAVGACAYLLTARRDLGAGLLADRPGRGAGSRWLRGPFGLAWRLQRGALLGWATALGFGGLVIGSIANTVGEFLDTPQARDMIMSLGGQSAITDAFLAAELSIIGVVVSAYGIAAANRLRTEEAELRAEPLLATAVGRVRWAASHLSVALLGTALLLAVVGLTAGLAHAAQTSDPDQIGRVLGAALVRLPGAWVLTGIAMLLFGYAPRMVTLAWVALVGFLLLGELGPMLELDQRVMNLSPYAHLPTLPGGQLSWTPLAWLTGVAAALVAAGCYGLRRRDLT